MTKFWFYVKIGGVFKKRKDIIPHLCQNDENGASYSGDLGQKIKK